MYRDEKLKALFLKEINSALRNKEELKRNAVLTITDVELTNEGKDLIVYFSVFGKEEEKKQIFLILNSMSLEIKQILKKRLRLKIIPNITFEFDDTPQRASRIEEIFRKISMEKNDENSPENSH